MTSDVIATGRKYRYRIATGEKLISLKHILLPSILVNNRVIVIENWQKIFQLQLYLLIFENFQLQLLQNHLIIIWSITIIIFPSLLITMAANVIDFYLSEQRQTQFTWPGAQSEICNERGLLRGSGTKKRSSPKFRRTFLSKFS